MELLADELQSFERLGAYRSGMYNVASADGLAPVRRALRIEANPAVGAEG